MQTSDFEYDLPPELIAQTPIEPRDHSRLMVIDRQTGSINHRKFFEITDFLRNGDLMVMNDTRVVPARLRARKPDTGGKLEVLLLHRLAPGVWETLVKPGKRVHPGSRIEILGRDGATALEAEVIDIKEGGTYIIKFTDETKLFGAGNIPLPPYIHQPLNNPERYQTVYSRSEGSVAAPTAGLHFTPELMQKIERMGVGIAYVTLHIELDTFRPVREEDPERHVIHREYGILPEETAVRINRAKAEGRRVICVGTTAVRMVEAVAKLSQEQTLKPFAGWVDLFILPGFRFRITEALITNFHLPRSTLLMLVSAFAGRELMLRAYREAIEQRYRFYSFGDAMLVL